MSRGSFPRYLFDALIGGTSNLSISAAPIRQRAAVLTSRVADCSPVMLREPHSEMPCAFCHEACVIHPETLRMTGGDRLIMCHGCAETRDYAPQEIVMHPMSAFDTIEAAARKRRS